MKKKRRKNAAPTFILWTRESQNRFDQAIAKQADLVARLDQLEKDFSKEKMLASSIRLELQVMVNDLRNITERLEVRSNAAKRANLTRRQAAGPEPIGQAAGPEAIGQALAPELVAIENAGIEAALCVMAQDGIPGAVEALDRHNQRIANQGPIAERK